MLESVGTTLKTHPKIETGAIPVRFVGIGTYSLDLEVFVYVLTTDGDEFLKIQQELLLTILDEVAAAGTALALPTQASVDYSSARQSGEPVHNGEALSEASLPGKALLSMAILSFITPAAQAAPKNGEPILEYIKRTWVVLTRSNRTLATSAVDPKFHLEPGGRWPVFISAMEDRAKVEAQLRREIDPDDLGLIDLRTLPDLAPPPGLLYLPRPYVVPGGRFNEMYGWDSYFIVRGLLRTAW